MKTSVKDSKRSLYKAAEVCALAKLQPYVLSTWEAEFPSLGVVQSEGKARVYRRADVDTVLRIKELIVSEGLTLGAARRRLLKESPSLDGQDAVPFEAVLDDTRAQVEKVKEGLRGILALLSKPGNDEAVIGGDTAGDGGTNSEVAARRRPPRRRAKVAIHKKA